MPKLVDASQTVETPKNLRPFLFHGLDLATKGSHAVGDCPFCGKEGKFSVEVETGKWRCFICNIGAENGKVIQGGNVFTFLRLLWDRSDAATNGATTELAKNRGLLDPSTLTRWGVCQSIIDRAWLVPGYAPDGKLCQLCRYAKSNGK